LSSSCGRSRDRPRRRRRRRRPLRDRAAKTGGRRRRPLSPLRTSGLSINAIYQRTYQGVVDITSRPQGFSPFGGGGGQAEASGFVYDKRDIITNQHVVDGATRSRQVLERQDLQGAPRRLRQPTDLAVVRVDAPSSAAPALLGDSSNVQVGDG
jgi:S1-C subfamily serine protease